MPLSEMTDILFRFVSPSILRLTLSVVAMVILNACATAHRSYYDDNPSIFPAEHGKARLAVIEFDERGDLWDASQVARADGMISKGVRPILITYVHGWRHDARPTDGDLRSFQNFINQISQASNRTVCGVFIGWRGASVQEEGISGLFGKPSTLLSFWGRKRITDQMAGVPFNNTVWRLAESTRKRNGNSILIGHSFGARIVEHALGPAAVAQMHNGQPMPYNLTFLINPASESLYARQLKLALRNWPKSSQPAIIALAAENDSATNRAWPLALLRSDGIRNRDYVLESIHDEESQKTYVRQTVGNDQRQWTHEVIEGSKIKIDPLANVTADNVSRTSGAFQIRLRDDKPEHVTICTVKPLASVEAKHQIESNAYWVIPLKKNILSGHGGVSSENGIFCKSMGDLMAGIIGKVGAIRQKGAIVPVSDPAQTEKTTAPKSSLTMPRLALPRL